jgi:hypothetical protein
MGCGGMNTYGAAFVALNPGTSATTVIAELVGSATMEIRVLRVAISGTIATTAAEFDAELIKESTASTGGTKTAATAVAFTTLNNLAATATFNGYTVTPTAGTLVGVIATNALFLPLTSAVGQTGIIWDFEAAGQMPALNAANECLAITLNAATPAHAPALDIYVWWAEVPLGS